MRSGVGVRRGVMLAASAALLSGCFVLDELDAGQEIMEKQAPKDSASAPTGKPASPETADPEDPQAAQRAWWSGARSLGAEPPQGESAGDPDAVVRCELGGSPRFMRLGDCLSQGGRARPH